MDATGYATLSRQSGLMRELQVIANNIANAATTGYRQEGLVFSEFIRAAPGQPSLSMGRAQVHSISAEQGPLTQTGGDFDLAIEGEGYFLVETPAGERLTRAGAFGPNAAGDLVNADGFRVLDAGGAPVFVPPDADAVHIGPDGTVTANGRPVGQIGLFVPDAATGLVREGGALLRADAGTGPAEGARVLQGFLEGSNVNAIDQMARMVEIQRAYELGQSFLDAEDDRIREAAKTLMR